MMATARPFELRIIRRHVVRRWLAWALFLYVSKLLGSLSVTAAGIFILGVFIEQRWPLPKVRLFGLGLPPNLLSWALALVTAWLIFKTLIPVLNTHLGDVVVTGMLATMLIFFLCTQVQLLRGRGLA
ncbi:MAG: hypothetical protein JWO94_2885 [Verrucomicrobiaceae bacterium]|nr:hypothetical protein [Verrucomicrobiaceae bacterium]